MILDCRNTLTSLTVLMSTNKHDKCDNQYLFLYNTFNDTLYEDGDK